jgi:hypothetical protein
MIKFWLLVFCLELSLAEVIVISPTELQRTFFAPYLRSVAPTDIFQYTGTLFAPYNINYCKNATTDTNQDFLNKFVVLDARGIYFSIYLMP